MSEQRTARFGLATRLSPAGYRRDTRRFGNVLRTGVPRLVVGDCLRPWLCDGDVIWSDSTVEPHDRDLVMVAMRYRKFSAMVGEHAPERTHDSIKQLRIVGGQRFLTCADGFVHADGQEIVGVVTAWYRPGWWRRPAVRKAYFPVPAAIGAECST